MNANETKFLKALYTRAKRKTKEFHDGYYYGVDVLKEIGVNLEDVREFITQGIYVELLEKEKIDGGIRISHDGIMYGMDKFDRPPLGFVPPNE